jgi:hypothetical protein
MGPIIKEEGMIFPFDSIQRQKNQKHVFFQEKAYYHIIHLMAYIQIFLLHIQIHNGNIILIFFGSKIIIIKWEN